MNTQINYTNTKDTVKAINRARLSNKDKWIFIQIDVEGKILLLRSFNTSIDLLKMDEIHYASGYGLKVSEFKAKINEALEA